MRRKCENTSSTTEHALHVVKGPPVQVALNNLGNVLKMNGNLQEAEEVKMGLGVNR